MNAFIKVSISVLGPGDKPPVHDPSKDLKDKNDNGVSKLFTPGRVKITGHIVKLCIFRAEHLAPLDLLANSYYFTFNNFCSGLTLTSRYHSPVRRRNPAL